MSKTLERACPDCGTDREFYLAASTSLHLGPKTKWACPECGHSFVRIGDAVDTGVHA
jgi:rubredoxin